MSKLLRIANRCSPTINSSFFDNKLEVKLDKRTIKRLRKKDNPDFKITNHSGDYRVETEKHSFGNTGGFKGKYYNTTVYDKTEPERLDSVAFSSDEGEDFKLASINSEIFEQALENHYGILKYLKQK